MSDKRQAYELGYDFENKAAERIRARGYQVERFGGVGESDLIIQRGRAVITAEVKTSKRTFAAPGRSGYQFLMRKPGADGGGDDVVLLACVQPGGGVEWFVMPGRALRGVAKIAIYDLENYRGKWAKYRGAWGVIDDQINSD